MTIARAHLKGQGRAEDLQAPKQAASRARLRRRVWKRGCGSVRSRIDGGWIRHAKG
jgi:hypothetical protein